MISFIIPVYNKGSVLYTTLNSLITSLKLTSFKDFEIIVVDDGSTDNSLEELLRFKRNHELAKSLKIFYYTQNIGKGFALKYGFWQSIGDPVIFLDGDMDIAVAHVVEALHTYKLRKPHMVIGSKYHPDSRTHYPFSRFLYSLILKSIIRILFNLKISDTQVGLKVFQRTPLSEIFPRLIIKRFACDLELLVVAKLLNFTEIIEIPVRINHTSANRSSVDLGAASNFCIDIAAIFYRKYILKYYNTDPAQQLIFNNSFKIQTA